MKEETLALLTTVDEVDAQREVEAFRVVEECQQNVGGVPAVFPEAEASGGHGASWAVGAGNVVGSTEQMDEQIARDSAAVVMPFAPLEEALGVPGDFRRGTEKPGPVTGLGASVQRGQCSSTHRSRSYGPSGRRPCLSWPIAPKQGVL